MEMGTFLGAFCGPRLRRFDSTFCSALGSVEKGLKRATSPAVTSRTSPSSSINGLRLAIEFGLPLVGFAKTDDSDSVGFGYVAEQVQPLVQIADGDSPHFTISEVVGEYCRFEVEIRGPLE
jgi:hypothetical protein